MRKKEEIAIQLKGVKKISIRTDRRRYSSGRFAKLVGQSKGERRIPILKSNKGKDWLVKLLWL